MNKTRNASEHIYDIYLKNQHPLWIKTILRRYHKNIASCLLTVLPVGDIRLLEVGPGRGYFYQEIKKLGKSISYAAIDWNQSIIENLGITEGYKSQATDMPIFSKKFNIIYASYIIEHLSNGISLYKFFRKCRKNLVPGGLLIILTNNALKQGIEFWHADYTHAYPTTPRNVAMALYDSGFHTVYIREITDFSVFLTKNASLWPLLSLTTRFFLMWYHHNMFSFIKSCFASVLRKKNPYSLSDTFFQFHIFTQHPGLFITARI